MSDTDSVGMAPDDEKPDQRAGTPPDEGEPRDQPAPSLEEAPPEPVTSGQDAPAARWIFPPDEQQTAPVPPPGGEPTAPPAALPPSQPQPGGWADTAPMDQPPVSRYPGPYPSAAWQPTPPRPDGPPRRGRAILAAVLAGLLLLSAGVGIGWSLTHFGTRSVALRGPETTSGRGGGQGLSLQQIQDRVDPAVVDVNVVMGDLFGGSGLGGGPGSRRAAGTGIVLTPTGEILTNNHVIDGATSISVAFTGRSGTFSATVVGADPSQDVALIQAKGVSGLPTATLGDSSALSVGQRVVAIGNALGRGGLPAATQGIVTGLERSITAGGGGEGAEHLSGLIQTNASISPGDSGGPLVNGAGQVVGMITAAQRFTPAQSKSNVGFAIAVARALGVVREVRAGHSSSTIILGQPAMMGVQVENLTPARSAQLGLGVSSGALVVGVVPQGPAAGAGISNGAVITGVNGRSIESADALAPAIHGHRPGERIQVTWVDGSGNHTAGVTLIAGPAV